MLRRFLFVLAGVSPCLGQASQDSACGELLERIASSTALAAQKYRSIVCGPLTEWRKYPNFQKMETFVGEKLDASADSRRVLSGCISLFPILFLNTYQHEYRDMHRSDDTKDWFSEHGSNLTQGFHYMAFIHCIGNANATALKKTLSGKLPTQKETDAILAATLGLNVAGNFWEEIELPLPDQKSLPPFATHGREVRTDLEDFKSGMLATIAYLTIVKTFEMKSPQFRCD